MMLDGGLCRGRVLLMLMMLDGGICRVRVLLANCQLMLMMLATGRCCA